MKCRWALGFAVFGVLLVAVPAEAQQPAKVWHLGILWGGPHTGGLVATSFLQELQKLGYAEGRNLAIEWRWAEAREQKLPALAAELVDANVDVIVAGGAAAVIAAKQVTTTVPIVMEINSDPVETGLVASYARPGGNVTGFSPITHELAGKRLEILTEAVPGIRRVAALLDPIPAQVPHIREVQSAAQALGLQLQPFEVRAPGDFAAAFAAVTADHPDAMLILGSPTTVIYRAQIIGFAAQARLPAMYDKREFMIDGGLMGYFPSRLEQARSTAAYVDKILKGAKPNDLPIEQPTRFELVVNLKTAAALGLTIPTSILGRADEVLE
jgi:putative ABC transport system substrate-binding protein